MGRGRGSLKGRGWEQTGRELGTVRKGAEMDYNEVARSRQGRGWELAGKGLRTGRKGAELVYSEVARSWQGRG
jgi:hypothetical protein